MPSLIVRSRDGSRRAYQLAGRPLCIGRAESCDIVLRNDGEVSREHARVWLDEHGHVLVADMQSKNGTRVDDAEPFHQQTRVAQKRIRIGEHDIEVVGAPPPEPDADTAVTFVPDYPAEPGSTRFFPATKGLDLSRQRLALLMSLAERIGGTFERKQLLEEALAACCEALQFERGLIALKTPRGEAELPVTRNVERDATGAYKVSRTLINRALLHGERAVVNNPATDLVGNMSDSLVRFPICSALSVPILNRGEILGVIYGDRITGAAVYGPADVDFLAAIAQEVGIGLANLRLFKEYVDSQKMYAELDAARRIQRALLPDAPLQVGPLALNGYNEPSSAVGGDYFDYFELGNGNVGFVIADVTGHGLPAALIMANLQAAVRVALTASAPLPELATRVNRLVCENTASDVFITAILGRIDPQSGTIDFVNAGHPAPILVGQPTHAASLEHNSLPLGVEPHETFAVQQIARNEHGGVVLFYTDGLDEAEDPAGKIMGIQAVAHALSELGRPSGDEALQAALNAVRQHLAGGKNRDDLTLLAVQLAPP
jgi:sigma-B regulation protein RsbU (phosphoserine phosphatase)